MTPMRIPILPPELQNQVQSELRTGEKLIWAQQPLPRLYRRQGIGAVLFGIPWTAFSIFWVAMAAMGTHRSGLPVVSIVFPMFGVPFVLIGFGMLSTPFWMGRKARGSIYAITDQRAIIFEGRAFGGIKVQSFMPERLTSLTRTERTDGTGDLIFEQFQQRAGSGTTTVRRGFVAIERVRDAEDLITSTLLAGRARPSGPGAIEAAWGSPIRPPARRRPLPGLRPATGRRAADGRAPIRGR